jgi:hypothetical protein
MSSRRNAGVLLGAVAVTAIACGGNPVSFVAAPGDTIGIPVGSEEYEDGTLGYGGDILASATGNGVPKYDDQRGSLLFVLQGPGSLTNQYSLLTRSVVNAYPDPGSPAGIQNNFGAVNDAFGLSQALAIVDIPSGANAPPPGTYTVLVNRALRSSSGATTYTVPAAAPSYSSAGYTLTIVSATGLSTPLSTIFSGSSYSTNSGIRQLYPFPRLILSLPSLPVSQLWPSAAHLVISCPTAKVSIKTVFEDQHLGRRSIVSWSSAPDPNNSSNTLITIDFATSESIASVKSIAIAFELKDPFGVGRASTSDFTVVAANFYDANGVIALSGPNSITIASIR